MGAVIRDMASYRILAWKDVPAAVEATDGTETVRAQLSPRFQELIDALAMREGSSESDAYLDGWAQGPEVERAGSAAAVAAEVAAECEARFADLVAARLGPGDGSPRAGSA
jgi:hypothetical protein